MLRIHLFGSFRLFVDDVPLTKPLSERQQSLLVYLLLHRHAPQSRQHLAFLLWPDSSETQARTNLRNLLHTLRQVLPDADRLLIGNALTVQWNPEISFFLDVATFEQAVVQAQQATTPANTRHWLEQAIATYEGDLLPGNYEDWIVSAREVLRQTFLYALDQLVRLLEESGDYAAAMGYAHLRLRQDPLHEPTYIALMRLHALSGDRAGVQRIYQQCVTTLAQELDVVPATGTREAYEFYLRMPVPNAGLPSTAPLPAPESELVHRTPRIRSLPTPSTPFLGRERELSDVALRLADPACRLLTLLGPGGIGKTHLAVQAARGHQSIFADGVVFVALAPVTGLEQVVAAIGSSLDLTFSGALEPTQQLLNYVREKELLLVLDNMEHVLEAATLVEALLTASPALKILVTSRERLNLVEEWLYDLGGLPVPGDADPHWQDASAVQLFWQSARRAQATFTLTEADRTLVLRICRLVAGMPLGLMLAATWVRVLSLAEIAGEIESNLDFLAAPHRNIPERHRSLRAVFDHSWQLLSSTEQRVLRQLSLCQGDFTREAAEAVAMTTLPVLAALVDKSLLRRRGVYYDMHELVRQYAAAHLQTDAQELAATRDRHARYYMRWLAAQASELKGMNHLAAEAAIEQEINNVRLAGSYALDRGWWSDLAAVVQPLSLFLIMKGLYREATDLFQQTIAHLQQLERAGALSTAQATLLGHIQAQLGYFLIRQGRIEQAGLPIEQGLQRLQSLPLSPALGDGFYALGTLMQYQNRYAEAEAALRECIDVRQRLADGFGESFALLMLGQNSYFAGDSEAAHRQSFHALQIARTSATPWVAAQALNWLGLTAFTVGRLDEAEMYARECMQLTQMWRGGAGIWLQASSRLYLSLVTWVRGEQDAARQILDEAIVLWKEIAQPTGRVHQLNILASVTLRLGVYALAGQIYRAALQMALAVENEPFALDALLGLADLESRCGDVVRAALWLAFAENHPHLRVASQDRVVDLRQRLHSLLSAQQQKEIETQAHTERFETIMAMINGAG